LIISRDMLGLLECDDTLEVVDQIINGELPYRGR
jgi:hypothetical protein